MKKFFHPTCCCNTNIVAVICISISTMHQSSKHLLIKQAHSQEHVNETDGHPYHSSVFL